MAARTIRNCCREHGTVSRWGGEEFLVVASPIGVEGMRSPGERTRVFLEQSLIGTREGQVRVTASLGGTMALAGEDHAAVVARADGLMYQVKRKSRNACLIA